MKEHPKSIEKEEPEKKQSSLINNITNDKNIPDNKNDIFKWRTLEDTVLCKAYNEFKPGTKLLSFDLDDTLTVGFFEKKKTDKPKSPNEEKEEKKEVKYTLSFDINKIKSKLDEYKKNNYVFALFSNQNGISLGHIKESDFKVKIDKIFSNDLKYPFATIFAKGKDYFRKPSPGMFEFFKKYFNENIELDLNECIFVGDAAGRKKSENYPKNDFSNSDYKFSINCQFKFNTPEEFFF